MAARECRVNHKMATVRGSPSKGENDNLRNTQGKENERGVRENENNTLVAT